MRYFRLHQDERTESGLLMNGSNKKGVREAFKGDLSLLDDLTVTTATSFKGELFTELLSRQVFMYKDSIKEVFNLYEPGLEYKNFCLIDTDNEVLHMYYSAPVLKIVSVISPKSKRPYSQNNIYLDKKIVEELDGLDIFRLSEPQDFILVSLPVAESLLRRKIPGILLTHIEMV